MKKFVTSMVVLGATLLPALASADGYMGLGTGFMSLSAGSYKLFDQDINWQEETFSAGTVGYVGWDFNQYFGVEVGFESYNQAEKQADFTWNGTVFGTVSPASSARQISSRLTPRSYYTHLKAYYPINDQWFIGALLGGSYEKTTLTTFITDADTPYATVSLDDNLAPKWVGNVGLSVDWMMLEQLGLSFTMIYRNTSSIESTTKHANKPGETYKHEPFRHSYSYLLTLYAML